MSEQTTCQQRSLFYQRYGQGESYEVIARDMGVSRECVRYWCRRQGVGQGAQSQYHREPAGLLSRFSPLVRYALLRLRVEHPRGGVSRIRHAAHHRYSLQGLRIPSLAQMGR